MLKKIILISYACISLFLNSTSLFTQETTNNSGNLSTKIGAKIGINFADLSTENASNNILIGLNLGLFAKMPVAKFFSVQPEVNFSVKGAKVDYATPLVTGSAKYSFNYLEVPLLAVINFTDNLSIHAGPYLAYMISGSTKNATSSNVFDFENTINPDNYNRVDYGGVVGASLDVERVGIGMRYSRGFNTIGNENTISGVLLKYPDAINSVYNIYVAISF